MNDTITITGIVASTPRHLETAEHLSATSFRLASAERRYDTNTNTWVEVGTNWYTISAFRQLADNINTSVQKGQRVIVTGRIRIRDWESDGNTGTNVEIEATAVGHDLAWGTTEYTKTPHNTEPDTRAAAMDDETQPF